MPTCDHLREVSGREHFRLTCGYTGGLCIDDSMTGLKCSIRWQAMQLEARPPRPPAPPAAPDEQGVLL